MTPTSKNDKGAKYGKSVFCDRGARVSTYTRVYTSAAARVAHLRPDWRGGDRVLCPAESRLLVGWLGTGSQEEYDRAAALPTCKRCEKIAEADG